MAWRDVYWGITGWGNFRKLDAAHMEMRLFSTEELIYFSNGGIQVYENPRS